MSGLVKLGTHVERQALFDVDATRRIEAEAAAGLPGFTLMARAGAAVARLCLAVAPHARRAVVHAGPGNNGGDGLIAAMHLHAWGKRVSVRLLGDESKRPADAAKALAMALQAGVDIDATWPTSEPAGDAPDLVVDALLGIGASRPPDGRIAEAIERIRTLGEGAATVVAIDVPSGLDARTGLELGDACVVARHTLSLLTAKPGLFTANGRDRAGTVWLAAIGAEPDPSLAAAWLIGSDALRALHQPRRFAQHKGSFGDVVIVGGAAGTVGAALLAARAAHAAGAGKVFVDLLGNDEPGFDSVRPELMFDPNWSSGPTEKLKRSTVVCGCGGGDAVREALPRLLSLVPRLVLDADALNALATDERLRTMCAERATRRQQTILTPHPLEAARLLGRSTREVQADRLSAAAELAERYRATIVLKGSGTVIAAPGQTPNIVATGNASLATAGTGDVLAGWTGGRWSEGSAGTQAFSVATLAAVEHGAAAEPAAAGALRASDLVEVLHRRSRRSASATEPLDAS